MSLKNFLATLGLLLWVALLIPVVDALQRPWESRSRVFNAPAVLAQGEPAGIIVLVDTGACPAGYTEIAGLNGRTVIGTLDANANVGTTGGADSVTPTFSGTALATQAHGVGTYTHATPAFTGTSSTAIVNHVHVENKNSATTGGLVGFAVDTSTSTSVATGYSTANPTGGVASYTPAGTVSNPAFSGSSESLSPGTPAGTVSAVDTREAFQRVIFCKKS